MARAWRGQGLVCLLSVLTCLTALASAGEEKPSAGTLRVTVEGGKAVTLSAKEWAKLPRGKVEVKGKGDATSTFDGVPLAEVLKAGGLSFEDHPRGRAATCVLVEGADSYRAVLALAEVDPKVADRVVLLADRLDGKPLADSAGPYRLVVPGDRLPVRWVKQVVGVSVHRLPGGDLKK